MAARFLPRLQNDCQKQKLQDQTEEDGRFRSKLITNHIVKIKLKEDIVMILIRITGGSEQHNKSRNVPAAGKALGLLCNLRRGLLSRE
jgi:hypothetical protein